MADNLNGLRKEFWNTGSFRMILKDALEYRPEHLPFDATLPADRQVENWKALSAERRGFDKAFQMITGHKPGDFNNE